MQIQKEDVLFFVACVLLGILAEVAFFHAVIGISYVIFIAALYWVFFWRFQSYAFVNRRIGYLLLTSIWLLAAGYALYSSPLFQVLNVLVIPGLVVTHIVLITSGGRNDWYRLRLIGHVVLRLLGGFSYNRRFLAAIGERMKGIEKGGSGRPAVKVGIGLLIALPFLLVVTMLLSSADAQFSRLMGKIPDWLLHVNVAEGVFRSLVVLFVALALFGFLQHVRTHEPKVHTEEKGRKRPWDSIIIATLLVAVNSVYVLFVIVQFQYFFSGTLQGDLTYAEYARRGFFELLLVTLINLSILIAVLTFTKMERGMKLFIRLMLTLFIAATGVMLVSAFQRLSMYEEAYGFTVERVLPHSFMLFLGVLLAYTLVKVWLEKLQLRHFYLIAALCYYTGLNLVNLDGLVMKQNLERFETTGKIDVYYLNTLSYEGVSGLVDLYDQHPDIPDLQAVLAERKNEMLRDEERWQSWNLAKSKAYEKLRNLQFKTP